jgi:hypothetical protein
MIGKVMIWHGFNKRCHYDEEGGEGLLQKGVVSEQPNRRSNGEVLK